MGNSKSHGLKPKDLRELCDNTKFSEGELKDWYKGFIRDCPDGNLDQQKFGEVYANFFPDGDATAFAEYAFKTFDADGNGLINFREFITAMSVTSRGSPKQKLQWAFNMYDLDNNGTISRAELLAILEAIYKLHPGIDLPEDESTPEKRTDKIFTHVDKNQDGVLTLDEFIDGAQNEPSLIRMFTDNK